MTALGDFSPGDVLTAADLNSIGTWQTWTPTFTNFTVSSYTAEYCQINDMVFAYFNSSDITAVTGDIELSLPVALQRPPFEIGTVGGTAFAFDVSGLDPYWGRPDTKNSTTLRIWNMVTTSIDRWNAGSPFTWATGDDLRLAIWYKAA